MSKQAEFPSREGTLTAIEAVAANARKISLWWHRLDDEEKLALATDQVTCELIETLISRTWKNGFYGWKAICRGKDEKYSEAMKQAYAKFECDRLGWIASLTEEQYSNFAKYKPGQG